MDHVAIMKKSWGFTEKIFDGRKSIESRWYDSKKAPWDAIKKGETVYFKNSGEAVSLKARVKKLIQFDNLNPVQARQILDEHGGSIGIEKKDMPVFLKIFRQKKYCVLIFLEKPEKILPFAINKKGFGAMAAWISVTSIDEIRQISQG